MRSVCLPHENELGLIAAGNWELRVHEQEQREEVCRPCLRHDRDRGALSLELDVDKHLLCRGRPVPPAFLVARASLIAPQGACLDFCAARHPDQWLENGARLWSCFSQKMLWFLTVGLHQMLHPNLQELATWPEQDVRSRSWVRARDSFCVAEFAENRIFDVLAEK